MLSNQQVRYAFAHYHHAHCQLPHYHCAEPKDYGQLTYKSGAIDDCCLRLVYRKYYRFIRLLD